ncbi:transcription factor [Phlyctema vagabunda]|uniref:Transcription factor n=1 Tax=Phlyctema vagabunda TaxID=108571 RepID=A0ABR4PYP5_9HELO
MDEHIHPADPVDIYLHTPKSNSDDLTSIAMSPAPFSVIEKQYELARIIDDLMASTRCKRAEHPSWQSVERLNVRLCAWHESLPTQLRWNRWTSSLDDIDLGVAGLHMLYHTTRISLNRSFLRSKKASAWVEASQNLCSASVELVVSILQRYRAQHSLRRAPLIFVHGTIIAADVLLRTSPSGLPVLDRGCLSVLEDALAQLAYSWDLARLAHEGMAKLSRQTPATTASYGGIVSSTRSRHAAPDLTAAEDGLEADSGFLNFDTGLFDVSVDMMVAAAESASSIFWAGVSDADMVEDRTMGFG